MALAALIATLGSSQVFAADAALVAAATKEGAVTFYTSFGTTLLARPLVDAFQKKYPGITVSMFNGNTGTIYQKIAAEEKAGKVNVDVSNGSSVAYSLYADGALESYLPDSAKDYDPAFIGPKDSWVTLVHYYQGVAVNTDLVKAEDYPKTT